MENLVEIRLEPTGRRLRVASGAPLQSALAEHGVEFPCGGGGRCGACRVKVLRGELPMTADDTGVLSPALLADGWRLACRAEAHTDVTLEVGQWDSVVLADDSVFEFEPRPGLGIAIDLGTTTMVAQLVDFSTGRVLGVRSALNPQAVHGSDVMSRLEAALAGHALDQLVAMLRESVGRLVSDLVVAGEVEPKGLRRVVVAGNTVMQHFFCGLDPRPLATWPFRPASGAAHHCRAGELGWPVRDELAVTFLPPLGGFVGSDLLCGVLATGLHRRETPSVLVDLGTNGEILVGNRDRILCASTAAGPAFEGGGIGMGMRATTGAVHRVRAQGNGFCATVFGGAAPRGICGSGLIDAVAVALDLGLLESSGRIAGDARTLEIAAPVVLTQQDIRQLQLAKAAVAAGLGILRRRFGDGAGRSATVWLAGAFGNHVDPASASRIGLVDAEASRIRPAGNTSLLGAKIALLAGDTAGYDYESILSRVEHVPLADDPAFAERYVEEMPFPGGR